jgi:hypothetical protein
MLIADDFPKLGTNLVTALTTLDMNNLTHFGMLKEKRKKKIKSVCDVRNGVCEL